MKKILTLLMALIAGLFGFASCNALGNNSSGEKEPIKKYISTFDWYKDCLVIPVSAWMGHLVEEGLIETEWNQEKTEYISEGKGSCRVTTREGTTKYKGHIMTNSELVAVDDINGAKLLSLDVYNPENKEISVSIDVVCGSKTVISVTKTCAAKQWTTVSTPIEDVSYDKVKFYTLTLENKVDEDTFTLYLDNFYVEFAE